MLVYQVICFILWRFIMKIENLADVPKISLLTYDVEPGVRSNCLMKPRRSHLTLVFGVILQGSIAHPQVIYAVTTVTDHGVPREARNNRREPCRTIKTVKSRHYSLLLPTNKNSQQLNVT
jgi:hypothetical protein